MISRRWVYPSFTRDDADELLRTKGTDGSFLARPCNGDFVLSVRRDTEILHIKVQNDYNFFDLFGGEKFCSLYDLVQYCMHNEGVLRHKNGKVIKLTSPLNSPEPTDSGWYHGYLTSSQAERMLLENGKNGSFLVRESLRQPGDLVLTMRMNDEIRHVVIRVKGKKYSVTDDITFDDLDTLIQYYRLYTMVKANGEVLIFKHPFNETPPRVRRLSTYVELLPKEGEDLTDNAFRNRKINITKNFKYSKIEGSLPANIGKNVYKNVLPFDNNRVILKDVSQYDPPGSDYINASYIQCDLDLSDENLSDTDDRADNYFIREEIVKSRKSMRHSMPCPLPQSDKSTAMSINKTYVATQGCLPKTVYAFWSMVWQEKISVIILATNEFEHGRMRCERYWPNLRQREIFRQYLIYNESESCTGDYVKRHLVIKRNNEHRTVYQYQFTAWPERGVPEPKKLLNMLTNVNIVLQRTIRTRKRTGEAVICVQCYDGIGRTGTFIVIDMIISLMKALGLDYDIDIHDAVQMARSQRPGMVANKQQYDLIYNTVLEYIKQEKTISVSPRVYNDPIDYLYCDSDSDSVSEDMEEEQNDILNDNSDSNGTSPIGNITGNQTSIVGLRNSDITTENQEAGLGDSSDENGTSQAGNIIIETSLVGNKKGENYGNWAISELVKENRDTNEFVKETTLVGLRDSDFTTENYEAGQNGMLNENADGNGTSEGGNITVETSLVGNSDSDSGNENVELGPNDMLNDICEDETSQADNITSNETSLVGNKNGNHYENWAISELVKENRDDNVFLQENENYMNWLSSIFEIIKKYFYTIVTGNSLIYYMHLILGPILVYVLILIFNYIYWLCAKRVVADR